MIMKLLAEIVDLLVFAIVKIKEIVRALAAILMELLDRGYRKFMEIGISEKLIVVTTIPAFLAVVLSVAQYYIFESYFYINNPLAVYMIGIVLVMLASVFFNGGVKCAVRVLVNGYYLGWIIYLPLAGELTKANPYSLRVGYYMNIAVPILYIVASLYSYFFARE